MQTGLRFLFVVTILLHLVNFVEKTRTEWTTSSYGKKSQLLPWVAGKQSLSFHPTRCLAAEDTECTCRALGTQEGARASPQHPAHPARCFGVGRQFHPLQWEWVRGKVVSLPWWRMCYCFRWVSERLACLFFFFNLFTMLSSATGMNKRKPNKNPWKTSSSRNSRWMRKILPPACSKLLFTSIH